MSPMTATSPVQILVPKDGYIKKNKGGLVVRGTADETIVNVLGECRLSSGTGPVIKGKTFLYNRVAGKTPGSSYCRWVMAFVIPPDPAQVTKYQLTVTGYDANLGIVATTSMTIYVDPHPQLTLINPALDAVANNHPNHLKLIPDPDIVTIATPSPGDNITDQADDFEPSGDLFDYELGPVSLTEETTGATVTVLQEVSDPWTYFFWLAQFDVVPPGTYTLSVQDASGPGSAQQVSGLTVD